MILLAIYGIFQRAIQMRDHAMERTRDAALRARASHLIRNDLSSGLYSGTGGVFATTLTASKQSQMSRFPGYLRFTTTTGKDSQSEAYGDVQQVEYSIADQATTASASLPGRNTGTLVRSITRDLLSTVQSSTTPRQENVLTRVESFEASFYDGSTWQPAWELTGSNALPQAIRVSIQQAAQTGAAPPPLEIFVPWTTGTSR